jgi:hypothetical protein
VPASRKIWGRRVWARGAAGQPPVHSTLRDPGSRAMAESGPGYRGLVPWRRFGVATAYSSQVSARGVW